MVFFSYGPVSRFLKDEALGNIGMRSEVIKKQAWANSETHGVVHICRDPFKILSLFPMPAIDSESLS